MNGSLNVKRRSLWRQLDCRHKLLIKKEGVILKILLKTVVTTALVTTLFACSTTSPTSNTKKDRFSKVDANSDGRVTVEEFSSSIRKPKNGPKRFSRLDVDKNGYLNRAELEAERKNKKNKKKN